MLLFKLHLPPVSDVLLTLIHHRAGTVVRVRSFLGDPEALING